MIKILRKLTLSAPLILMSLCSFAQNWQLVWSDEFTSGISGDWVFETGGGGWGNNELEYYRQENASVQNGQLVLTAKREGFGGYNYTSVRMKTQGRKSWKYGKIEARIAMPSFSGAWPAFWMLGDNISSVGWPSCGEIDIMEHINTGNTDYGTIHWNNNGHVQYSNNTQVNNITAFHTYTITWDANSINWFVDGVQYSSASIANNVNNTGAFHNNFFILLNFAIGGAWPGYNIDNNAFPANMYVDYVRVYQDMGGNTGGGGGGTGGVATVYKDCNYGGYAVGLPVGRYDLSDLTARGISNDDISSLKVNAGYQVQMFWDAGFAGSSTIVTSDNSCLVSNGWNDQASSLIVSTVTNTGGGGGGGGTGTVIQAENYSSMSGVQTEACSEGGSDVGYIDAGDWMAYNNINIPSTGTYTLQYRVASPNGGTLSSDLNAGSVQLGNVGIPATGGWQNWTTVSKTVTLNAGTYNFGIYAQTGGYNINWFSITPQSVSTFSTTIQAENFSSMSGIQTEACSDAGGGSDVGYIDAGDWMAYNNINFPVSGNYTIQYRVASQNGGGTISSDLNAGSIKLGTVGVPSTGGWQNWTTISQNVNVNAGTYNFGIYAAAGGFNLNWIKITAGNAKLASDNSSDESYNQSFDIYPIPVGNTLNISSTNDLTDGNIQIVDAVGKEVLNTSFTSSFDVSALQPGVYILRYTKDGNTITKRFVK